MSDLTKYSLYFVLGGTVVSISTYLGSLGRGYLAALASTFPVITGMTFVLIYLTTGTDHTFSYAKNLLWFVPPWVAYVSFIILSIHRLGFWAAILGGFALYMSCVGLIKLALR